MKIISTKKMRELDQKAITEAGISGETLMDRAGSEAADNIIDYLSKLNQNHVKRFVMFAGKGNNGGDIYATARHLSKKSCTEIIIYSICSITELKGDSKIHAEKIYKKIDIIIKKKLTPTLFKRGDIIVDGLLGTGFKGELREQYKGWIEQINQPSLPTISLDIPSGLDGDAGTVSSVAVLADLTVTMGLPKVGLFFEKGPEYCGITKVADIGIPESFIKESQSNLCLTTDNYCYRTLKRIPSESHKKQLGEVLIIGGSKLYPNAPYLSGNAALRAGTGLVTVATPEGSSISAHSFMSIVPRKIKTSDTGFFSSESITELKELINKNDAIAIGPGMTERQDCLNIIELVVKSGKPAIFDADAINIISKSKLLFPLHKKIILTPHPGEAKRLATGLNIEGFCKLSRIKQASILAKKTGATILLKGNKTIITDNDKTAYINASGNQSLATAGSGDVLTGIIITFLSQGISPISSARLGAFIHGATGETNKFGIRGLTADDIINLIPEVLKELSPFG